MLEINKKIFEAIKGRFHDGKEYNPYVGAKRIEDRWIQISTAYENSVGRLHYELYQGKVELHFEGDCHKKDEGIKALIEFLKQKIENGLWEDWEYGYRCQLTKDLDEDNYLEELTQFIKEVDTLIEEHLHPLLNSMCEIKDDPEMGKTNEEVSVWSKNLESILKLPLRIPDYQRIYCWEDRNIIDLWNNITEISDKHYHLGTIILHRREGENGNNTYDIIDGQQRLVTLTLILLGLKGETLYETTSLLRERFLSKEARDHVANAKALIDDLILHKESGASFESLPTKLVFNILLLTSDNIDLAYTFFSNQNSKGVPLSDYDLLKAHHLRYIYVEAEQEHLAQQWNKITKANEETHELEQVMGTHLYRLRNWMRKRNFDENRRLRVRDEFSAAPIMKGIPPFGEKFEYYEKIQGGAHFFAYTNHFIDCYRVFGETKQVKLLRDHLQYETHYRYESVIETLLFAYYLKFGNQYLSEALFCIAGVMAQHRYTVNRALMYKIREYANNSEVVMMVDQATSPTFFLAEALALIRISGKSNEEIKGIKERFYQCLKRIFNELNDFTDKTITDKKQKEYDEQRK